MGPCAKFNARGAAPAVAVAVADVDSEGALCCAAAELITKNHLITGVTISLFTYNFIHSSSKVSGRDSPNLAQVQQSLICVATRL